MEPLLVDKGVIEDFTCVNLCKVAPIIRVAAQEQELHQHGNCLRIGAFYSTHISNVSEIDLEGSRQGLHGHECLRVVHDFKATDIFIVLKYGKEP
ncbi:2-oxoglutarate (2OG) and Fe(II)-dependent oxygenase superfamily protein [Actinidia rufa]|uniref:2-oxoglutarate (2OG) and Fe(II)-dependent oxygenase superfamily protein n=1 Tax=Actinidia rufa TaxID=165716 RepID=A0A7J0DP47_9ERIC|nr:2-oxoglutarate (2OG) and Fe(II)-dependent oxygenase superfamily protein [Actinidia rufa]